MNELVVISWKWKVNQNITTQKHWTAIYILPIQRWESDSWPAFRCSRKYLFNFSERPKVFIQWNRPNPFYYVLHQVFWLVHICSSKCIVSVILLSLTAHNDSDSGIASLAGWLRVGSHGTHWHPGRAGPGSLNLKPRFAKPRIMAGTGVRLAQRWTYDIRQSRCATSNLNLADIYHTIHPLTSSLVV
jgi:hypothetical protein